MSIHMMHMISYFAYFYRPGHVQSESKGMVSNKREVESIGESHNPYSKYTASIRYAIINTTHVHIYTAFQRGKSKASLHGSCGSLSSCHFRELTDVTIVINNEDIATLENIGEGILIHSNNIYSMKDCWQGSLGLCIRLDLAPREEIAMWWPSRH